jgi:hypothetical protein
MCTPSAIFRGQTAFRHINRVVELTFLCHSHRRQSCGLLISPNVHAGASFLRHQGICRAQLSCLGRFGSGGSVGQDWGSDGSGAGPRPFGSVDQVGGAPQRPGWRFQIGLPGAFVPLPRVRGHGGLDPVGDGAVLALSDPSDPLPERRPKAHVDARGAEMGCRGHGKASLGLRGTCTLHAFVA